MQNRRKDRRSKVREENERAARLVDEIVATSRGFLDDRASVGDLKIVGATLKEMRTGFRIFARYAGVRKVSIFGSARTRRGDPIFEVAQRFARSIAEAGYMIITGAGGGVMEACQQGAGRERSFGVNIALPQEQEANRVIHGDEKLIQFRYFFTRKLFFIKEAHAVVLFPGGFGTHDEGFEVLTLLQTGKSQPIPLVLLDRAGGTYWKTWQRYVEDHLLRRGMISPDDLALYKIAATPEEAVDEIRRYYRIFHSARYVRRLLVLRLVRAVSDGFVARLSAEFADILDGEPIIQRAAFPIERNEPEIWRLPRLALHFDRLNYGRLRSLIDRVNEADD